MPPRTNDEDVDKGRTTSSSMSKEERRKKRQQAKARVKNEGGTEPLATAVTSTTWQDDSQTAKLLRMNEDELIRIVANINKIYQDKLKRSAPFMTFVFCGMQSAGKSTIMERFLHAVLNIVQQGTGTRCPLDTTCIHDESLSSPVCNLRGAELDAEKENISGHEVFRLITEVNRKLAAEDRFSTEPLYLEYRANNVQNMRFVDTPGIISTRSETSADNREEIKKILKSEMRKDNAKLCVLLEPKELQTNPIIDFCDDTFGHREKWINRATFLMTKFDKQIGDLPSANKANDFFRNFHENRCFPHLVITPILEKEDLPSSELYTARRLLLDSASSYEEEKFSAWKEDLDICATKFQDDEVIGKEVEERIGFDTAKNIMRQIMLDDTAKRLPEVLKALRGELSESTKELATLKAKQKYSDPKEVRRIVGLMLIQIEKRIQAYLMGDIESSIKYPERLQTLDEEIDDEEDDEDWAGRPLNHYSEKEDDWRDLIAGMECEYPEELQADSKFLGGKQYQRALEFFRTVLLEALPDPEGLREHVSTSTGHLSDGLHRENWEHAMVEVVRFSMKDISHPGINYLIKHVGSIFRRLFALAVDDVKEGGHESSTYRHLPDKVETFLVARFDDALWELMEDASMKTHTGLEPMYRTIDPNLPTFHEYSEAKSDDEHEKAKEDIASWFFEKVKALASSSGQKAKEFLKMESKRRALKKKSFLPDQRTSMITNEEIDTILQRAFEYIVALMEFNLILLKFQLNAYLFEGFKNKLTTFSTMLANDDDIDWKAIVSSEDDSLKNRIVVVQERVASISESLRDVESLQRRL